MCTPAEPADGTGTIKAHADAVAPELRDASYVPTSAPEAAQGDAAGSRRTPSAPVSPVPTTHTCWVVPSGTRWVGATSLMENPTPRAIDPTCGLEREVEGGGSSVKRGGRPGGAAARRVVTRHRVYYIGLV